mgnify:CR=1 FL=1
MESVMVASVLGEQRDKSAFFRGSVIDCDHHRHITVVVHVGLRHVEMRVEGEQLRQQRGD